MANRKGDEVTLKADRRPLAAALVLVVAAASAWFLFTSPARGEADQATKELADAASTLSVNQAKLTALKSGQERSAAALLDRARQLDALLPDTADKVALVTRVDSVARSTGVALLQMNPGEEAVQGTSKATRFEVQVSGTASQVTAFLRSVTGERPLMTMSNVTVNSSGAGAEGTTTAALQLQVWSVTQPTLQETAKQETVLR